MAGTDFFTAEVLALRGVVTYYVLLVIHLGSRRVDITEITEYPDEAWMEQIARNVTMDDCGALRGSRYLQHDRDSKFTGRSGPSLRGARWTISRCPRAART